MKKLIPYNDSNVEEEFKLILQLHYENKDIEEKLDKLIGTLCLRILMLNNLINESKTDLETLEKLAKENKIKEIMDFLGI